MKIGRQDKLEVLGEFPLSTLLLAKKGGTHKFKCGNKTYSVKMNSSRYKTFLKSMSCVACGAVGKRLFLERFQNEKGAPPFFNMYAVEQGELVQMTKDHSVPKAMGGRDRRENLNTMCFVCNQLKGSNTFLGLDHIARIKRTIMAAGPKKTIGFWLVRKDLKNGDVVARNVGIFLDHDKTRASAKAAAKLNRDGIKYYSGKNRNAFSVWPQFLLGPLTGIKRP